MKQLATDAVQYPSLAMLGVEPFRAAMEFAWHTFTKSDGAKPGDGHPVVIFPGLGADGTSVATLRAHCRSLGYDAFDWGQGLNAGPQGDLDTWLQGLKASIGISGSRRPQVAAEPAPRISSNLRAWRRLRDVGALRAECAKGDDRPRRR